MKFDVIFNIVLFFFIIIQEFFLFCFGETVIIDIISVLSKTMLTRRKEISYFI